VRVDETFNALVPKLLRTDIDPHPWQLRPGDIPSQRVAPALPRGSIEPRPGAELGALEVQSFGGKSY